MRPHTRSYISISREKRNLNIYPQFCRAVVPGAALFWEEDMDLFREVKHPRSLLFGMKLTESEVEWLRTRAMKEGLSKSSFVRKLLANVVEKEGSHARTQRRSRNG